MEEIQGCPVCSGRNLREVILVREVPVFCNLLFDSREEARSVARGDIALTWCGHCGHLFNKAFDPQIMEYDQQYENALDFSPSFQNYLNGLTDSLIGQYGIRGKNVIDVGCGQGEFLLRLCRKGSNKGIGYDPGYRPDDRERGSRGDAKTREEEISRGDAKAQREGGSCEDAKTQRREVSRGDAEARGGETFLADHSPVTFVQDYYSSRYADQTAGFISARHVLEHISDPNSFIRMMKKSLAADPKAILFIEVPNGEYTIDQLAIWDLIYEHISYFTPASLTRLMEANALRIINLAPAFGDQYLTAFTVAAGGDKVSGPLAEFSAPTNRIPDSITQFSERFRRKTAYWEHRLSGWHDQEKKVVIWGAGSKGVTFLNIVDPHGTIDFAVDINPRKTNRFTAGTGQQIKAPAFLTEWKPDHLLIMNPLYRDEIESMLRDLGVSAETHLI